MFVGRRKELMFLEERYEKNQFDFIPIYGRRRVGKTELIHKFIEGKRHIVYAATEQNASLSLQQFADQVSSLFALPYKLVFQEWDQIFEFIGAQINDEKLIIAIDEYPYLAKQSPELSSVLQKHMDHTFKDRNVMFILCGSSMSFMEEQVLGYQSPLYGRRTGQIKLLPFNYMEAAEFMPDAPVEDKFLLYSVCGGIPQYLRAVCAYDSLEEGIVKNFFETTGHLYEEPYNLLKQELREPTNYFSIITAIASGKNRSNEIAAASGVDNTTVSKYLKTLMDLDIIEKRSPAGVKSKKKSLYIVKDNCFRFWFRFVFTNKTGIEFGNGSDIWTMIKKEALPTFQGPVFEKVASDYLMLKSVFKDLRVKSVESWWGNNPLEKKSEEIDIVADCYENVYIIGECKWRNEETKSSILLDLQRKAGLLTFAVGKYFCLFSKSGYSEELIKIAEGDPRIALIALKDMYM